MRRTIVCVLMVMFVLQTVSISVWTREAYAAPSGGGSGTSADPYIILTPQDLSDVRSNLSAHYRLGANIDLAGYDFDGSGPDTGGWMPIGSTSSTPFKGTLDGNGYAIRNITINRPFIRVGLFGAIGTNAQLMNVRLLDINVTGSGAPSISAPGGALAGNLLSGSTIRNSIATGRISMSGADAAAGGLVGINAGGTIENSHAVVHVSGAAMRHGGLVGTNAGTIRNSYAAGNVFGDQEVGGLVGYHNSGSIENSYAAGNVTGISGVGGLVGRNDTGNTFPDSYWNMENSGQLTSYGGTGVTTEGMKDTNTFAGWNTSIWGFRDRETYPYLLASKLGIGVNPLAGATYSLHPGQDALSVTGNVYHETNGEQVAVKYDIRDGSNVTVISATYNETSDGGSAQAINRRLPLAGLNNGNYTLIVTASDAHNMVVGAMLAFKVDTAILPPPSVSLGTNGNENWSQSASTAVTVSDSGGGVNDSTLQYAWSAELSTPIAGWTAFASGDTLTKSGAEGDWYLHIRAKDAGGNTANVVSGRFRLDNTNPAISFGTSGSEMFAQSASTTVTVSDNSSGSGVNASALQYAWTTDTVTPGAGWLSFMSGDTLTKSGANGDWYLHIRAQDTAGNTVNAQSNRFRLDNTAPTVSFGTNGSETWGQLASTAVSVTDNGSGVDATTQKEYAWNADTATPASGWTSFANGDTLTKSGTDGDWYLHIRAQDKTGNTANARSNRFQLDNTAPTVNIAMTTGDGNVYSDNTWTNQNVAVSVSTSDSSSVTPSLTYSLDGGATWNHYASTIELQSDSVYSLSFKASDQAGNETVEQCTVKINKSGLKLTPTLVKADGNAYTSGSWTNQNVTLSVYAEAGASGIASLTYVLNGGAAQAYASGTPITFDQAGAHAITFQVTDMAGNTLSASLAVNIDKTSPSVTFGTNGSETWTNSAQSTVMVTDSGNGVNASTLQYAWSVDTSIPAAGWMSFMSGDTVTKSGADRDLYLHIRAQDTAGNTVNAQSNRFRLDNTAPTVSFGTNGSETWGQLASTAVSVTDNGSGVDATTQKEYAWNADTATPASGWTSFANGDTLTKSGTDGDWYLHIRAQDKTGNTANARSNRFRLDNTAPTVNIAMTTGDGNVYSDNTWTNQNVAVSVSTSDSSSVTPSLTYSLDGGATWNHYASTIELQSDSVYSLSFKASDQAGNETVEQCTVKINKSGLKLTPTLVKADGNAYTSGSWTNQNVTLSVYAEAGASGIASLTYVLNGGAAQAYASGTPITFDQAGAHAITFQVTDMAGNTLSASLAVNIDKTSPSVTFGTNGSETWTNSAQSTVMVTDSGNGVNASTLQYAWSVDTSTPAAGWMSFMSGDTVTKSGADGDLYLHIRASDAAGNQVNAVSNRFRLDASAAELSGLSLSAGTMSPAFSGNTISYSAHVSNGISGIMVTPITADTSDAVTVSVNGGLPQTVTSGTKSGTLALHEGANTITVAVTALNGAQNSYTVTVNRADRQSDSPQSGTNLAPDSIDPEFILDSSGAVKLIVDPSMIDKITQPDGSVIEIVKLDDRMLTQSSELLKKAGRPILTIEVNDTEQAVKVPIPAFWISSVVNSVPNAIIEVELSGSSFQLVISVLDLEGLAAQLGVELKDLKVNVTIEQVSGQVRKELEQTAASRGGKVIGSAVDYKVTVEANGRSGEVRDFGGTYMSRAIVLDADDAGKVIMAVLYDPATRTISFVPSVHAVRVDDTREISMSVPHNSIYAIVEADGKTFADLIGHWAKADVELLASKLIVQGVTDSRFDPNADVTRAEFAALLVRALGLSMNPQAASSSFADVATSAWYAPAVEAAVKAGLVGGTAPDRFAPGERITREQMAVMLARALTVTGKQASAADLESGRLAKFADRASISVWALASVDQAVAAGIIKGMTDDTFAPSEYATRAQASVMLKRLLQHVQFLD
ncbi:S-layer homology domain-containing protein [Paenibacillus sp. MBLB4367]|uniref:S-layer homology domain-containing protein n=1 Tax=Paenibacillus sp. MBLB4367 TaxID=3384767 RepID=UPI003908286A